MSPEVKLSSADRVLFPEDGITKGDLFEYYERIARARAASARPAVHDEALPRRDRARRLLPEAGAERHAGVDCDAAVRTHPREGGSRLVDFPLVNSREALLWMVQMHCIDMNAWYSRFDKPGRPDYVVFDLDPPDEPDGFAQAIEVAHLIHGLLDELELGGVREDERRGRDPRACADPAAGSFEETYDFAERGVAAARGAASRPRDDGVAEAQAERRPRRSPPERLGQDDRVGVLGAPEAGRAGLDAASVGGADARGAAARVHDGGRARAGGAARRPLRAGARGQAAARRGGKAPAPPSRRARVGYPRLDGRAHPRRDPRRPRRRHRPRAAAAGHRARHGARHRDRGRHRLAHDRPHDRRLPASRLLRAPGRRGAHARFPASAASPSPSA